MCMYIAPPLPKGKLPQLPRPRETNHKSTRSGLTHGALGSLTSLPPFTFPPHPAAAAARRPPLGPAAPTPAFPTTACTASQVTTAPLSPTPPARAGLPRWGGCAQQGVVDGGDGLLCGLGPQPGRASQHGTHPLHNAHCSGYQHTAGVRCPLPTAHCPLSPFCFLPLHAVPRLVPGPR